MEKKQVLPFQSVFVDATKEGTKIPTTEYLDAGLYPIIDQGQNDIAGYSNAVEGLFYDVPCIVFGDHTRVIKYVDKPFFLGADGVKVLKPLDKDINTKYLYYVLANTRIPDTGYNRHFKWLKESNIVVYTREKQNDIVSTLDLVEHLISLRKKQLQKLDDLVKSRFVEMFGDFKTNPKGWPVVGFDEIAIIDGNMTTDYEKYANYPHIGIDSIEKESGLLTGYRTVAEDSVISGKYIFTPFHIIYSKIRPNLNKVALPDFYGLCSADAYPILPIEGKCDRVFLAFNMRSTYFLDYILQFCNRTNLPKVNRKELSGFRTPLPPMELQTKFASFVAQVEKNKKIVQQGLDKLELLKQSLMQKYFG